ncbi:MAG TPA: hypothetical protein VFA30_01650 [Gaiellaceae bacterium]|nr:hypothetical protein [Gaiellaceae bacterium]
MGQTDATGRRSKGEKDVAWAYPEPQHAAEPVRDMSVFFNDIDVDGELQARPRTQGST